MLSSLGKLSSIVTIAGGLLLAGSGPANAMAMEPCTAEEQQYVCEMGTLESYYENGSWYCGVAYGCNAAYDASNERYITWGISYYDNGPYPCPTTMPC